MEIPWNPLKFNEIRRNSMKSIEIHEIHGNSMKSIAIQWNPWKFHEIHGNSMKSMEILWNPLKFHEIHGKSMKSMEIHGHTDLSGSGLAVGFKLLGLPWSLPPPILNSLESEVLAVFTAAVFFRDLLEGSGVLLRAVGSWTGLAVRRGTLGTRFWSLNIRFGIRLDTLSWWPFFIQLGYDFLAPGGLGP